MASQLLGREQHTGWRQFNNYWASQSFAQAAGQVLNVGFPLIAAELLGLRPSEVAVTTSLQFIPYLVVTPIAGIIVDRINRIRLVMTCHALRAVLLALVGLLAANASLTAPVLWLTVFLAGALNALASVGTLALVPDLAPDGGLAKANSRLQLSMSITQVIGPSAAGLLLAVSGNLVFFAIALAFGLAAAMIVRTRAREVEREKESTDSWLATIVAGVRFVRQTTTLWVLLLQMTLFNLFEQAVITLFMLFALRELDLGSTQVGLVFGAGAIGSVAGAWLAPRFKSARGISAILVLSTGLASVAPCALPFVPQGSPVGAMAMSAVAFCFYGFGLTVFNVHSNTLRHQLAPRELQGRLAAVFRTSAFTSIALGAALGGVLAEQISFRTAIGVACTGLVSAFLLFACLLTRATRTT
ncbi:MFS transporter [Streptomyces sp. AC602_WCS936]|uniref:MFS transporter n=1 Tax=Streptomyces sp. AC602_WCS936 TaxID=2823685 RepID=UPI001C25D3B2|nr:MFS transporter [Streptomyces sp. AC602_WCS936]